MQQRLPCRALPRQRSDPDVRMNVMFRYQSRINAGCGNLLAKAILLSAGDNGGDVAEQIDALLDSEGALLATVLDQTHDCIKLLNLDGVIHYVNRQGASAMELSSPAELIGLSYLDRWPASVRTIVEASLESARHGDLGRFQASRPQPSGLPSWWDVTVSPVRAAGGAITHFLTIARDMTIEVRERERVETIGLEMRHRLQNSLSVAGGIVALSARGLPEVATFATEVVRRIGHLADVQALVLDPVADTCLTQVIPALFGAYGDEAGIEFGELPKAKLSYESMQALSLCYGELATNSLKYGALRNGDRIHIEGSVVENEIRLVWCEQTKFGAARPGGQGLRLVERLIRTAGGTLRREVDGTQMRTFVSLPMASR